MMSDIEHVWYCLNCGEPQDVTYEERCVGCGSIVKAIPKTSFDIIEAVLSLHSGAVPDERLALASKVLTDGTLDTLRVAAALAGLYHLPEVWGPTTFTSSSGDEPCPTCGGSGECENPAHGVVGRYDLGYPTMTCPDCLGSGVK